MFLDTGVNSNTPADYKLQAAEHPYATDGNIYLISKVESFL